MRAKGFKDESFKIKKVGANASKKSNRYSIYDEYDMEDDYMDEIPSEFDDFAMDDDNYFDEDEIGYIDEDNY